VSERSATKGTAGAVRLAVEGALERYAQGASQKVEIVADDGKVILTGSVYSRAERDAIVEGARASTGVREVDDRLRVEP